MLIIRIIANRDLVKAKSARCCKFKKVINNPVFFANLATPSESICIGCIGGFMSISFVVDT